MLASLVVDRPFWAVRARLLVTPTTSALAPKSRALLLLDARASTHRLERQPCLRAAAGSDPPGVRPIDQ
jgi:hypothetical protein